MKGILKLFIFFILIVSCKSLQPTELRENADFVIAFGSCNKQYLNNVLWKEVIKHKPRLWIWGGDNIYSDTDNMLKMKRDYEKQLSQSDYKLLVNTTKVVGIWDDHDYGLNDGGEEFHAKKGSQQLFLDFLGVDKNDKRRKQEGVYSVENIITEKGSVKVLLLDTRYFRTSLTESEGPKKRYQPNPYGQGTILGSQQWEWLTNELTNSKADFNLIVSSIQFLSDSHGYETWGNYPHEIDKLKALIQNSRAKGVLLLSGDRHISEFSKTAIDNVKYPLIDFTSSGLTHTYDTFVRETNDLRMGKVVNEISFGVLKINFKTKTVVMQMRGVDNVLQQELIQTY